MPKSRPQSFDWGLFVYKGVGDMTWRAVHISDSEQIRLKLDNLLVKKQGTSITIPLSDISMIVAEGGDTIVTLRLMSALSKYNIALVVCDQNHIPTGIYTAYNGHFKSYKKQMKQLSWSDYRKSKLWEMVIEMKLANQLDLLIITEKSEVAIQLISSYMDEIEIGDKTNREGHAAKVYFNELFGMKFTRQTQMETDVINAGLNYGYTIIRAQMARLIMGYGLNPIMGIFHRNEYNQFNLADDLMEPFRQLVDRWVYENLQDEDYLKFSHRLSLINLMNAKVKLGKEYCTVVGAMDKFVQAFMKNMDTKMIKRMNYPIVSSLESEKIDEV